MSDKNEGKIVVDLLSPEAPTPLAYLTKAETIALMTVHFECFEDGDNPNKAAEHLYNCLISAQLTKNQKGEVDLTKYGVREGYIDDR